MAASDFVVNTTGTLQAGTPVVAGSGTTYTVTISGVHGDGDLQLELIANTTIQANGLALGGPGAGNRSFTGQTYSVLQTFSTVVSISQTTPVASITNASSITYTVSVQRSRDGR